MRSTLWLVVLACSAAGAGCGAGGARQINRVPIVLTTPPAAGSDEIGGMIVPVRFEGRDAALAIDTGSALTFLYTGRGSAEFTARAGAVQLGRESLDLPGRSFEADDETGADIVGVLGADFLLGTTTEFDPCALEITRFEVGASPSVEGWTRVPLENVRGHIILTLTIDGHAKRLMWDTGSPHLLLINEGGRPGDSEARASDVEGSEFVIYTGSAVLSIPGEGPRTIPALRAPSFPYFEGTVEALGGNIAGLAGQSVFGHRRLLFDASRGVMLVSPHDGCKEPGAR